MRRVLTLILAVTFLTLPALAAQEEALVHGTVKSMAEEHPVYLQCELGSVCADSMREAAGTNLALVCIGELGEDLPQSAVTREELRRVVPFDRELAVAEVTPKTLWVMLEQAVSRVSLDLETERVDEEASRFEGFCNVSGMSVRYDASAPVGERVLKITLEDGTELDRNDDAAVYTLCATAFLLEGGYGFPKVEFQGIETTQSEALERYLQAHLDLPEGESDRITVVGARREGILGVLPTKTVVIGCLVFCVYLGFSGRKLKRYRDEYGNAP